MKLNFFKLLSVVGFLLFGFIQSDAQFTFGAKAGLSSFDLDKELVVLQNNEKEDYNIKYKDSNLGFHIGLYGEAKLSMFSVNVGALFNTTRVNYTVSDINATEIVRSLKKKTYRYLDIPVLIGMKISRFTLQVGPVAHMFVSSTGSLLESENYEEMFRHATFGYQAGVKIKLLDNLNVEMNYEGNLDSFGPGIAYEGNTYNFTKRPRRLVASISVRLL